MARYFLSRVPSSPPLLLFSTLFLASVLASAVVAQQPGPPFSPCEVTSIRLSPASADPSDSNQWQVLWSRDGGGSGYKSLSPFAVGADGSTVLRVQVAFTPGAEASYRSVVTATVNDNGYMQYFRAPGPSANPPVFEQELSGFAAGSSGSTTNKLVLNADCETLFEAQVVFANAGSQDDDAGSSSGQGGGSDGSTPPPQGGFEDSTGSSDGGSGTGGIGSGSSSTADFIDEDGNGIPDNIFASSSGATGTNSTGSNPDGNDGDGSLEGASAAATEAQPLALVLAAALSAATVLLAQR